MITAVDTNVLLHVFAADPIFGARSARALRSCLGEGRLIACETVWAEVAGVFPALAQAREAMESLPAEFSALDLEAALAAVSAWKAHRAQEGRRQRVVADFLIGARKRLQADRPLTRDRGFHRAYFAGLSVLAPSTFDCGAHAHNGGAHRA